jgi:hypothetical protein
VTTFLRTAADGLLNARFVYRIFVEGDKVVAADEEGNEWCLAARSLKEAWLEVHGASPPPDQERENRVDSVT